MSSVDDLKQGRDRSLSIEDIIDIVRRLPPEFAAGAGADTRRTMATPTTPCWERLSKRSLLRRLPAASRRWSSPPGVGNTYVFDHSQAQPPPAAVYFKDRVIEIPLAMSSIAPGRNRA